MNLQVLTKKIKLVDSDLDYELLGIPAPDIEGDYIFVDVYIRPSDIESIWILNHPEHGLVMNVLCLGVENDILAKFDENVIAKFELLNN